jgi:hypothetical protein
MSSRTSIAWRRVVAATIILIVAGVADIHAANTAAPSLALTFSENSVVVSNATPAGRIVLLGLSISRGLAPVQHSERLVLTDDDRDGIVRFTPKYSLATQSVWIAVDFDSGSYVISGVPGYRANILAFPESKLKHDGSGEVASIEEDRHALTIAIVRPGTGAWSATPRQGGPLDLDGPSDGKLKFAFSAATPFVGTDALKHLKNGDVVVGLDARQMQFYVGRIGK